MPEKPGLSEAVLRTCLRDRYGIAAVYRTPIRIRSDWQIAIYRVRAVEGADYFVKTGPGGAGDAGLAAVMHLKEAGVTQVVAPLTARDGRLWTEANGGVLVVYPFLEGRTGKEAGLSDTQWVEFGGLLRSIHATPVPPDLAARLRRETFAPEWSGLAGRLDAVIQRGAFRDSAEGEFALLWQDHRNEIRRVVDRRAEIGRVLLARPVEHVLCHADLHRGNLLIDAAGRVNLVDWDDPVLAPKERDLIFVEPDRGGLAQAARETALFYQGYGDTAEDPVARAYYRYEWAASEIVGFGDSVFLDPVSTGATKDHAVQGFADLFRTGGVVAQALGSDTSLPTGSKT
jgi:spectinomycin phosphotransferase